jgi:hypothetical protein
MYHGIFASRIIFRENFRFRESFREKFRYFSRNFRENTVSILGRTMRSLDDVTNMRKPEFRAGIFEHLWGPLTTPHFHDSWSPHLFKNPASEKKK